MTGTVHHRPSHIHAADHQNQDLAIHAAIPRPAAANSHANTPNLRRPVTNRRIRTTRPAGRSLGGEASAVVTQAESRTHPLCYCAAISGRMACQTDGMW